MSEVKAVIDVARRITGKPKAAEVRPRRAGDPPALVAEAARVHNVLRRNPQYAKPEVQVQHAWAWLKMHA